MDWLPNRLLLWRPFQDVIFAWRFWTALKAAQHADWRDRVGWASGVMMARSIKAKQIELPVSVELTERNTARVTA